MDRMKKYKGLCKLVLMVTLSCVTQIMMLMKSSIVAGTFGISSDMDSYNFANSISTFILSFVTAGVSTIVIPCYVKKTERKSINTFLTIILFGMVITTAFVLLLRNQIISLITEQNDDFVNMTGNIVTILVIANLFSIFTSITSAYFQYVDKFNLPKIIALFSQVAVIVSVMMFSNITILQYAIIVGFGIVLNSVIDVLFAIKAGWCYKPAFDVKDVETKKMICTFIPMLFGSGVYQLSLLIDSSIASRLNTGAITLLNYSNQISSMINTLLVSNLLTYFYPKLVKDIKQNKNQHCFWEKTMFLHAIMCLVVAGYTVIGHEGIALLFEHGKFDADATSSVFTLGFVYILSQPMNVVRDLIYRYFYSFDDTKSVTFNSTLATAVNIVFSLLLIHFIDVYGIVLGTAISSLISLITIMFRFKKKYGYGENVCRIIVQYIRTILITIVSILVVLMTKHLFVINSNCFSILLYGTEVILVYMSLTLFFNRRIKKIALQI